jgi:hypothetical protein
LDTSGTINKNTDKIVVNKDGTAKIYIYVYQATAIEVKEIIQKLTELLPKLK